MQRRTAVLPAIFQQTGGGTSVAMRSKSVRISQLAVSTVRFVHLSVYVQDRIVRGTYTSYVSPPFIQTAARGTGTVNYNAGDLDAWLPQCVNPLSSAVYFTSSRLNESLILMANMDLIVCFCAWHRDDTVINAVINDRQVGMPYFVSPYICHSALVRSRRKKKYYKEHNNRPYRISVCVWSVLCCLFLHANFARKCLACSSDMFFHLRRIYALCIDRDVSAPLISAPVLSWVVPGLL